MSQQGIADIEAKGGRPRKLYEIARACGVSPEWLLGESVERDGGSPSSTKPVRSSTPSASGISRRSLPEYDVRAGASYGGGIDDTAWQDGDVAGHQPIAHWGLPTAYVERELGLSYGLADIIPVRGDSMDDGTARALTSGDRVIIDRKDTDPRQGGIFAVWDGDGVIIKQVEILRGSETPSIICSSRNSNYRPVILQLTGGVRIIGRVAARLSRL